MLPSLRHRLPGEFETHSRTYVLWPERPDNWRENARPAQQAMANFVQILSETENVRVGVATTDLELVRAQLDCRAELFRIPYDDVWVRDTGPMFLTAQGLDPVAIDWNFNSWGGLFDECAQDNAVARAISNIEHLTPVAASLVLEGGAIITDGCGTLILTRESVLNENRNPGLTQHEVEELFHRYLNAQNIVWLEAGLKDDEAGGHIDNVCSFADPKTLLVADTSDDEHPSYRRVKDAQQRLCGALNTRGEPYRIVRVPMPDPAWITAEEASGLARSAGTIKRTKGSPLCESHLNLYIANGMVVVPIYGGRTDTPALEIIRSAFPGRKVVPFACREFVLGGGGVHCLTRDVPLLKI